MNTNGNVTQTLKVIQINLGRGNSALKDLITFATDNHYDLAAIQEPYTSNNKELRVTGHKVFQRLTTEVVKSAVIILNPNLDGFLQTEFSNSYMTTVDIQFHSVKFRLINVYHRPDDDMVETVSMIRRAYIRPDYDGNVIITGDFNAHHNTWDIKNRNDTKGYVLHNFVTSYPLGIINTGSVPTFEATRNQKTVNSIIDLTIASDNLIPKITDWKVETDAVVNTEHNAITFNINTQRDEHTPIIKLSTTKYKTKKADWDLFHSELTNQLTSKNVTEVRVNSVSNITGIDKFVEDMTTALRNACDKAIPKIKRKRRSCHWYDNKLKDMKHRINTLRNRIRCAHRNPPSEAVEELRQEREKYSVAMQETALNSFKEHLRKQGRGDVWSKVKPIIVNSNTIKPPASLKIDGRFTSTPKETAEALVGHFYPNDNPSTDSLSQRILRNETDTDYNAEEEPPFTEQEVIDVLRCMNPKKAPGLDHFTSDIVLRFAESHISVLTKLYNKCLEWSLFPTNWKRALIKVLPKPGKADYESLCSFRPIGLLSVFGKVLEALIKSRLTYDLHKRNMLSGKQYGFTEQSSSTDAIRSAVDFIKTSKRMRKHVVAVSLDIKGAFDNAWWPTLLNGLRKRKTKINIYKLIKSYLNDRTVQLDLLDQSIIKTTTKGCIQGSVMGPTYWNIILDDLLNTPFPANITIQAYADDVLLIGTETDINKLETTMNTALEIIHEWGANNKLEFGPHKTQVLAFTKASKRTKLEMNGVPLQHEMEIKYLGVIIDWELKFTKHVQHVIDKAQKVYKFITRITRPTWGVSSEIIRIIYQRAVEPIITYASVVWQRALEFKYICKKLESFQRPYAVRIAKGFHTISTIAALALADLLPLELRIREIIETEEVKLNGVTRFLQNDRPYQGRIRFTERYHPIERLQPKWLRVESEGAAERHERTVGTSIYTDGSKLNGCVGAAFVVRERNSIVKTKKLKLERYCSVFQAELIAIENALDYVWKRNRSISNVKIFTDSEAAIRSIENRKNNNPIVHKIHTLLRNIEMERIKLRFVWIRAHNGIIGNELADALAKEATTLKTAPVYDKFPLSFAKREIRNKTLESWNNIYMKSKKGEELKKNLPTIHNTHQLYNLNKACFELTQILTGHAFNKSYLKRFNITDTDSCPCDGQTIQTIDHLFQECPKYANERRYLKTECSRTGTNFRSFTNVLRSESAFTAYMDFTKSIINTLKKFNTETDH